MQNQVNCGVNDKMSQKTIDAYQAMKIAGEILDQNQFGETWLDAHSLWFDSGMAYIKSIMENYGN